LDCVARVATRHHCVWLGSCEQDALRQAIEPMGFRISGKSLARLL